MVGGISKRQQARNERALQDLIRTIPGNDRCADCGAMNPGESCQFPPQWCAGSDFGFFALL